MPLSLPTITTRRRGHFVFGNYPSRTLSLTNGTASSNDVGSPRNSKLCSKPAGRNDRRVRTVRQTTTTTSPHRYDPGLYLGLASLSTRLEQINHSNRMAERFSVSYTTGSHAFKVGISMTTRGRVSTTANQNVNYVQPGQIRERGRSCPTCGDDCGCASSITRVCDSVPRYMRIGANMASCPGPVDDQRLTLNYGLRFSYFDASSPRRPDPIRALRRTSTRSTVALLGGPRSAVRGGMRPVRERKTALKASWARFVNNQHHDCPGQQSFVTSVNSVTRSWNDPTGNGSSVPTVT